MDGKGPSERREILLVMRKPSDLNPQRCSVCSLGEVSSSVFLTFSFFRLHVLPASLTGIQVLSATFQFFCENLRPT